ncbi:MAG: GNAT family N-acetyltransferase [Hyphomicrobiaceae bacterium]|nr:GNAT family N-acetyltransferase [Hyphomicrobiaceae bacterium]
MTSGPPLVARTHDSIASIAAETWDGLANPDPSRFDPFLSHAFLAALEDAGCVGPGSGWRALPISLETADGDVLGLAPTYLKTHSRGEYVFDHAWADALERAGGRYYPKLQCAVPFTPVPGRRLLVAPGPEAEHTRRHLAAAAVEVAGRAGLSSLHITFATADEWRDLGAMGFLQRTDQQFHFANPGYRDFEDFLATLASRKRKAIRREREEAVANSVTVHALSGADITESAWDAFFAFYMDTGNRKWGQPYLNRPFFSLLGERLGERCLLVLASRLGRPIAGALHLIGGDCLYGRYWGAIEHHPFLHFELCYYQAIDYAIAQGLPRVEAGAQGDHKIARGYLPATTYSVHWIADAELAAGVARYLEAERRHVERARDMLAELAPYRRNGGTAGAAGEGD